MTLRERVEAHYLANFCRVADLDDLTGLVRAELLRAAETARSMIGARRHEIAEAIERQAE